MTKAIKVLEPSGVLELENTSQLRQTVLDAVTQGADGILLDLCQVTFMTSSGLGVIVATYTSLKHMGKELFLCSLNEQLRMIFELTGVNDHLKIFANREAFEQQIRTVGS